MNRDGALSSSETATITISGSFTISVNEGSSDPPVGEPKIPDFRPNLDDTETGGDEKTDSDIPSYEMPDEDFFGEDEPVATTEEDYLTGLYNRRKIHEIIETEIIRSKRYNSAFSVILIDIDDFKIVNDTFGHNTGDKVLVQFSGTLKHTIRESDIASRWGGEEFLVIMPETTIDGASALAEKLRSNIENCDFKNIGNITASFGVTGIRHGDNVQSLIHRADEALYSAKEAGKNTVKAAE